MHWPIILDADEHEDPSLTVTSTLRRSEVLALADYCEEQNIGRERYPYTRAGVIRAAVRFAMENIDDFQEWLDEEELG